MAKKTRKGLGRGLSSLLGDSYDEAAPSRRAPETVINEMAAENAKVVEREASRPAYQAPQSDQPSERPAEPRPRDVERVHEAVRAQPVETAQPVARPRAEQPSAPASAEKAGTVQEMAERRLDELPLDSIQPNPEQPRTNFKKEDLEELAASIEKEGLLQPIVVRKAGDHYQIIAGERRWQACRSLGLQSVPVRIKEADDDKALELALIENVQRSDLNPIEEAYGYKRLMDRRHMTQSEVAQAVSKGRSTIANALRLLELPENAQQLLFEEKITAGHARAILSVPTKEGRQKLTERLANEKLSVRETEALARLMAGREAQKDNPVHRAPTPKAFKKAARGLRETLGTNVRVKTVQGKNKIEIEFADENDLERIFGLIIH